MATPSNGRALDLRSDLDKDYATLKAIRNLADNATNDLADAFKRFVGDRHQGADRDEPPRRKPWLPLADLRLVPTMADVTGAKPVAFGIQAGWPRQRTRSGR
jgi:hypothetical protein